MAVEYKRIVLRKGIDIDLTNLDLLPGELAFTTDTHRLFIGTSTGKKEVPVENIEINDLVDVDTSGVANGDVLKYSTTTSKWEAEKDRYVTGINISTILGTETKIISLTINGQAQGLSTVLTNALTLDDIGGVSVANVQNENVLMYNGTNWQNIALPLESLGNVTISEVQAGQVLKWNGSAWINSLDTDSQVTVDSFGFEAGTYNLQLQQTNNTDYDVDFSPVVVKNFELNTAAPLYQIDLTLQDDTVLTADLIGLRNSDINGFTLNNTNDPGQLTIETVGGQTYGIDTFAVYDQRYIQENHSHGKINGDGQIEPGTPGIDVDIETGDKLLIVNSGASSTITTADILFDTAETGKYLSQAGEFTTPTFDTSGLATDDHEHGFITNDGHIKTQFANPVTAPNSIIATGDHILIAKNANAEIGAAAKLWPTAITFDTTQTTKFLSQDGTFKIPTFNPGTYTETVIDTLDTTNNTELVTALTSYDKIMAVLYPEFTGSANTTTNGDTVPIYVSDQLNFVQTTVDNVCLDGNGDPILGPTNQAQCDIAGGTWTPQYNNNYGRVAFQPGGSIERINSTQVRFNLPTAVSGVNWKLKLIGVTF